MLCVLIRRVCTCSFFLGGEGRHFTGTVTYFNFGNLLEVLVSGLEIPWIRLDGGIFVELNIWFPFNMNYLILLWIHPKSWTARPWKMMAKEDDPFLLGPDGQLSGASFISFRVYSYLNIQGPNYIYISPHHTNLPCHIGTCGISAPQVEHDVGWH